MSAKGLFRHAPVRVLVAEDDANDVLLLQRAFVKAKISAVLTFVSDGKQAIDYLLGQPPFDNRAQHPFPDLLLLDLNMPGTGGLEVLQWLLTRPEMAALKVGVFSSCIAPEASRLAVQMGAQCCIHKPLDPLELLPVFQDLGRCAA